MCGVPYHAVDTYLARLVERGHRIALCDQLEDPQKARGLVRRDVVRVVTPGTVIDSALLPPDANNYLVAVTPSNRGWGLAAADLSTGEFQVTEFTTDGRDARLMEEVARFAPREILVPESSAARLAEAAASGIRLTTLEDWRVADPPPHQLPPTHFKSSTPQGFRCETPPAPRRAAWGMST